MGMPEFSVPSSLPVRRVRAYTLTFWSEAAYSGTFTSGLVIINFYNIGTSYKWGINPSTNYQLNTESLTSVEIPSGATTFQLEFEATASFGTSNIHIDDIDLEPVPEPPPASLATVALCGLTSWRMAEATVCIAGSG